MINGISKSLSNVIKFLVFSYVFFALSIPGIPGWSWLAALFALLLILVLGAWYCVNAKSMRLGNWIYLPLLFMFHCALLALFASIQGEGRMEVFFSLMAGWGGASAVAIAVSNGVRINIVLNAMVLAAFVNAIAVMLGVDVYITYSADLNVVPEDALLKRSSGLIGNPNLLAIYAILPVFCLFAWGRNIGRGTWLVGLTCAIFAVYSTGSIKAFMLIVLLFIALLAKGMSWRRARLAVPSIAVLCVLALVVFANSIGEYLSNNVYAFQRVVLVFAGTETSYLDRINLISSTLGVFLDSPLWGHGLDMSRVVTGTGVYAHTNVLELAVNGGVLFVASYYAMYAMIAVRTKINSVSTSYDRTGMLFLLLSLLAIDLGTVLYNQKIISLVLLLGMATVSQPAIGERLRRIAHL